MIWIPIPTESGQYRWRETEQGRIHSVRVTLKKGTTTIVCKTMDIRRVSAGGEWCLKAGEESTDPLDGILA